MCLCLNSCFNVFLRTGVHPLHSESGEILLFGKVYDIHFYTFGSLSLCVSLCLSLSFSCACISPSPISLTLSLPLSPSLCVSVYLSVCLCLCRFSNVVLLWEKYKLWWICETSVAVYQQANVLSLEDFSLGLPSVLSVI